MRPAVRYRDGFREAFRLVVTGALTRRIHVAPILLGLRVDLRITVYLGGGSEQKPRALLLGQPERLVGTERTDLQGLDRYLQEINRASRRREMENVIDRAVHIDVVRHIVFEEQEPLVPHQVCYVVGGAGGQVVKRNDVTSFLDKPVTKMRP